MSNDSECVKNLIKSQNIDTDDVSSSASDLNCSDLVQGSYTEGNVNKQIPKSTLSTSGDILTGTDVQQAINAQILAQLSAISDRLSVIESRDCK